MSDISLIQFENNEGGIISEILQVPNLIDLSQLKSLISTNQPLYFNGLKIEQTLESVLTEEQKKDIEKVKKIRLGQDIPTAQSAVYCTGTYSGHEGPILSVKYTNEKILSIGGDKTLRVWDRFTKLQSIIVQKHTHWVLSVDSNKDLVATGGMDNLVNIYEKDGSYIKTLNGHKNGVIGVKFFDDTKLLSVSRDGIGIVWSMDGKILTSWAHRSPIKSFCINKNLILTGSTDGSIMINENLKYKQNLKGHTSSVNCIDSMGDYTVSGDDDGNFIIWKNFSLCFRLKHKKEVISCSISPNGLLAASGSFDKTVCVWSLESGMLIAKYHHVLSVYKVRLFQDLVISCSKDKTVKMYRISKKKCISTLVCDDEVYDFDYMDGGLVVGTRSGKIQFFN